MNTSAQIQPTGCMSWCRTDDPRNHSDDDGKSVGQSRVLAEGVDSPHYGPIYTVSLQHTTDDEKTRLFVTVETATLTADQAEVLGRALLEGAAALRASGDIAARETSAGATSTRQAG